MDICRTYSVHLSDKIRICPTIGNRKWEVEKMNGQIEIVRAGKIPIYFAEFVVHHDCWSVGLKEVMVEQEIKEVPIRIVPEIPKTDRELKTIRFILPWKLPTTDVKLMLRTGVKMHTIKKATVRLNSNTMFELIVDDAPLNIVSSVERLPFGDISKYSIQLVDDSVCEFFRVYISSEKKDAREVIRELDDGLREKGEAYLNRMGEVREGYTLPELVDILRAQPVIALLRPSEIRILKTALEKGYFDVPKKATLDELSTSLEISKTQLNNQLREITKKISKVFLDELREFFLEEE